MKKKLFLHEYQGLSIKQENLILKYCWINRLFSLLLNGIQ